MDHSIDTCTNKRVALQLRAANDAAILRFIVSFDSTFLAGIENSKLLWKFSAQGSFPCNTKTRRDSPSFLRCICLLIPKKSTHNSFNLSRSSVTSALIRERVGRSGLNLVRYFFFLPYLFKCYTKLHSPSLPPRQIPLNAR